MRFVVFWLFFTFMGLGLVTPVSAQESNVPPLQEFSKARVVEVKKEGVRIIDKVKNPYQDIVVEILDGKDKGKTVAIQSGSQMTLHDSQLVKKGDTIILTKIPGMDGKMQYQVYETYRINSLLILLVIFFLVVIAVARWKGVGSIIGLGISLAIIFFYIIPQILSGSDPLQVSILGSLVILFVTTYLAHGISKQTTVALLSTFVALLFTAWLSSLFVTIAHLTGLTEETSSLVFGPTSGINIQGLLLGGIIIGTLGALNDVTTTQTAAVFELAKIDKKLSVTKLFTKGFAVGREHVVSLINTLVLAYAGSSLALFLFIGLNPQKLPLWVIINSEDLSEEIIRTIAGSLGLILVVPIVTLLAAYVCSREWK